MGYISLALNFTFLMYIGVFAGIPLLFLFHSFRPTLPWSCDAFLVWIKDVYKDKDYSNNLCNTSLTRSGVISGAADQDFSNSTTEQDYIDYVDYSMYRNQLIPSDIFFRSLFGGFTSLASSRTYFALSWQLLFFMFIAWGLIALFFYKITDIRKIGLFMRYSIWTICALMGLLIIRFSFAELGVEALEEFFYPTLEHVANGVETLPIFIASAFGAGWGVIISLASYNKFETNLMSYSWIICIGQALIVVMYGLTSFMIDSQFVALSGGVRYAAIAGKQWMIFLSSGSAMAHFGWPNLWCILFYSLLTLCAMLMIIIQLFAVFTAIFDDFEYLRTRKQEVQLGIIGIVALSSVYFCSNHGLSSFSALTIDSLITQIALNLLLILVVLWIYGRERFQRDTAFMLGQPFATWRIFVLRFIAPITMVLALLTCLAFAVYEHVFGTGTILMTAIFLIVIPWLFVPGYAIFRMCQQISGSYWERFKRCSRPTDWYPVETEHRQRYEEAVGTVDMAQQLNEVDA